MEIKAEKLGIELQDRWTIDVEDIAGNPITGRIRQVYWERAAEWRAKRRNDTTNEATQRTSQDRADRERVESAERASKATLAELLPAAAAADPEGRGKWLASFLEHHRRVGSFFVAASMASDAVSTAARGSWAAAEEKYVFTFFEMLYGDPTAGEGPALIAADAALTAELKVGDDERRQAAKEREVAEREAARAAAREAMAQAAVAAAARAAASAEEAARTAAVEREAGVNVAPESVPTQSADGQAVTSDAEAASSGDASTATPETSAADADAPDFLDMPDGASRMGEGVASSATFGPAGRKRPGGTFQVRA